MVQSQGMQTFLGGIFQWLSKALSLFIGKWKISFPLITALIIILSGGIHSIEQGSIAPIVKETGGYIFSSTSIMYKESNKIVVNKGLIVNSEKPTGFVATIKFYWEFLKSMSKLIWSIVAIFWMFAIFKVISKWALNNESLGIGGWIMAVTVFFILTFGYAALWIYPDIELEQGTTIPISTKLFTPVAGFYELYKASPYIITPVYNKLAPETNATKLLNRTVNVVVS